MWTKKIKRMVNKGKKCIIDGCNNTARAKHYCMSCYEKFIVKKRKKDFRNCS